MRRKLNRWHWVWDITRWAMRKRTILFIRKNRWNSPIEDLSNVLRLSIYFSTLCMMCFYWPFANFLLNMLNPNFFGFFFFHYYYYLAWTWNLRRLACLCSLFSSAIFQTFNNVSCSLQYRPFLRQSVFWAAAWVWLIGASWKCN